MDAKTLAEIEARATRIERRLVEAGLDHAITDDLKALVAEVKAERERCSRFIQAADARTLRIEELEAELSRYKSLEPAPSGYPEGDDDW